MPNIDLIRFLKPFTEREQIYKIFKEENGNLENLRSFIKSTQEHEIIVDEFGRVLLPGINYGMPKSFDEDNTFLSLTDNIVVSMHIRYTPLFVHSHSFFEIAYVLNGRCVNTIAGKTLHMRGGDYCIIAPGTCHSMAVFDDSLIINILIRKSTFHEVFFHLLSYDNFLSKFFNKTIHETHFNDYILCHITDDSQLNTTLESLIWEGICNDPYSQNLKENLLLAVFGYIIRNHTNNIELSDAGSFKDPSGVSILSYLQENYKTASLNSTAQQYEYSSTHLSRKIKQDTGMTFSEIKQDIRIKKACSFLANTELNVFEISNLAGYPSVEHFYRTFKKIMGMTPSEYRKSLQS